MSEQGQPEKDWRDSEPFDAKKYKNFYQLAGGVFITVVILLVGGLIYNDPEAGYWVNIYATVVGTILTIAVLDRRAEQRTIRERKEELILQMGSSDNAFAVEAVRLLRLKGWLVDGSLKQINFYRADLQKARLYQANLQGDVLVNVNLQEAKLEYANLQNANLSGTNLQGAQLYRANLREAEFTSTTILPDGIRWSPGRDLREFTDPEEWKAEQFAKQSSAI